MIKLINRIVSGGQTGVDRAALDVALALGIACGGWCPKGRRAEDGVIAATYPLIETEGRSYRQRTRLNVQDSDATLILNRGKLQGGTAYTQQLAQKMDKPCWVVQLDAPADPEKVMTWLRAHNVQTLNVAGPRESNCPGIHAAAFDVLRSWLSIYKDDGSESARGSAEDHNDTR